MSPGIERGSWHHKRSAASSSKDPAWLRGDSERSWGGTAVDLEYFSGSELGSLALPCGVRLEFPSLTVAPSTLFSALFSRAHSSHPILLAVGRTHLVISANDE